jgi:hypothetical protein
MGGPKSGGSSASRTVNAPSVSSAVAFTVLAKLPKSIDRPSAGRRTTCVRFLAARPELPEVNVWRGDSIAGGGFFVNYSALPVRLIWAASVVPSTSCGSGR